MPWGRGYDDDQGELQEEVLDPYRDVSFSYTTIL